MYGIEPTQREEQRRKQGLRLMVEERLVEIGQVLASGGNALADAYDVADSGVRKIVKFGRENKRHTVVGLFLAAIILAMIL